MASQPENFWYSDLFVALITLVVGTFGLYLYYRRNKDSKRRLAKIVLLEIENAQSQLKDAKKLIADNPEGPLPEHIYSMPANSWGQNKHLFVEDFKPAEWNAINEFYDLCELFDESIQHNDGRFGNLESEIRHYVQKVSYRFAVDYCQKIMDEKDEEKREVILEEFFKKRDIAINMLTSRRFIHIYTPTKQNEIIKSCLDNIDLNLSLNIVGQKLEKLSKNKFKFF